jgi:hypothetical protein
MSIDIEIALIDVQRYERFWGEAIEILDEIDSAVDRLMDDASKNVGYMGLMSFNHHVCLCSQHLEKRNRPRRPRQAMGQVGSAGRHVTVLATGR